MIPQHLIRRWGRLAAPLTALVTPGMAAQSQERVIDQGAFIITHGGAVIGREEFTVRSGTTLAASGFTITATAYYPPDHPTITVAPVVELNSDSLPRAAQFDVFGGGQRRIVVRITPRRVIVRSHTARGESASEFAPDSRYFVVDDSVFSLYSLLPGSRPGSVHLLAPRQGRRSRLDLRVAGTEATTVGTTSMQLRHVTIGSGADSRHLWFDEQARLLKVEVPTTGLVATRDLNAPPPAPTPPPR